MLLKKISGGLKLEREADCCMYSGGRLVCPSEVTQFVGQTGDKMQSK